MSDKETVVKLVQSLPDAVKLTEIAKAIHFLVAVQEGEDAADRRDVHSHEEVQTMFKLLEQRRKEYLNGRSQTDSADEVMIRARAPIK